MFLVLTGQGEYLKWFRNVHLEHSSVFSLVVNRLTVSFGVLWSIGLYYYFLGKANNAGLIAS